MKTIEQIFDEEANKGMIQYELKDFKRTFPTLYKVICSSMKVHTKQYLDEAIECVCVSRYDEPHEQEREIKEDILKLKEQIK